MATRYQEEHIGKRLSLLLSNLVLEGYSGKSIKSALVYYVMTGVLALIYCVCFNFQETLAIGSVFTISSVLASGVGLLILANVARSYAKRESEIEQLRLELNESVARMRQIQETVAIEYRKNNVTLEAVSELAENVQESLAQIVDEREIQQLVEQAAKEVVSDSSGEIIQAVLKKIESTIKEQQKIAQQQRSQQQ